MHPLEGLDIRDYDMKLQHKPNADTAWDIVKEFYEYYGKHEAHESLWTVVAEALISSNSDSTEGIKRANMVFFYEYARALIRAVYILYEEEFLPDTGDGTDPEG